VKSLNLPESTRSLKRVGLGALELLATRRATAAGTATTSFVRLAWRGFAKALRPSGPRKITVFFDRVDSKFLPVIVRVPPTLTRIGRTRVIDGFDAIAPDAVGAPTSRAMADSMSRQMVKRRRIAIPPIDGPYR
jgi:hypothetical protein